MSKTIDVPDIKSWWSGDKRVEPYMYRLIEALDRSGLTGAARTDVYNRAYESIHQVIIDYSGATPFLNTKETQPSEGANDAD